jgi:thiol:disulfide interchange protein
MNAVRRLAPSIVIVLLVALGCTKPAPQDTSEPEDLGPTQASNSAKVVAATAPTTPTPKTDPGGEAFHNLSFADALKKAKTDNKLVMVDFYADWCQPCKKLDATTWKDDKVQAWLREKMVAIKLDKDKSKAVADKYKIGVLPAMLFVRPDGFEVGRLMGYCNPEQFLHEASELIALK